MTLGHSVGNSFPFQPTLNYINWLVNNGYVLYHEFFILLIRSLSKNVNGIVMITFLKHFDLAQCDKTF
jgi:hypothetical protein